MPTQDNQAASETYSGWANWETWNVALWFGNEEPLYRAVRKRLGAVGKFDEVTVETFVRKVLPNGTKDFPKASGFKLYAKVDWQAIAADFNEMGE